MPLEVLIKCPNCGLSLTAEHRKGNQLLCPACKNPYEIKLKTSEKLGKCPYGCGETIRTEDYIDDTKLQCVHCHRYSIVRTTLNKPWSLPLDGTPVLTKYLGKCPNCQKIIGDSDRDGSGNLACPDCHIQLVARSEYNVSEKIGDCPICGYPLGKIDIGVGDKCYCENCHQVFILDHTTRKIPDGNLYLPPPMTADEFKYKCFELFLDKAPADIASKLKIKQLKVSYVPATKDAICVQDDPETFIFVKDTKESIGKKFGGSVELPPDPAASTPGNSICYIPRYELIYTYGQKERRFWMTHGDKVVSHEDLPVTQRLTDDTCFTDAEINIISLVVIISAVAWWWTSTDGILSGIWNLILAVLGLIGIIVLVFSLSGVIRKRYQKRKIKDFLSYHGLDYRSKLKHLKYDD